MASGAVVENVEFISVGITSAVSAVATEKRFAGHLTVRELKGKLELITGASMNTMTIEVFDENKVSRGKLTNDDVTLSSVLFKNARLHVTDVETVDYYDVNSVEKFEISKEEYEKREDSVQAFKKRNNLGRFNPEVQEKLAAIAAENKERAASINIGDRCETRVPNNAVRRGEVVFVGETDFKDGMWIGVRYDEPVGKHDGCVKGKRYFKCDDKYGGFVQPRYCFVGEFPPEEDFSDDEI